MQFISNHEILHSRASYEGKKKKKRKEEEGKERGRKEKGRKGERVRGVY